MCLALYLFQSILVKIHSNPEVCKKFYDTSKLVIAEQFFTYFKVLSSRKFLFVISQNISQNF